MEGIRPFIHPAEFRRGMRRADPKLTTAACRSPPALLAKRLRGDAGLLAEKAGKMRRVREGELVSDFVDRLIGEDELAFRLGRNALADEVACGDPGTTLDVIVQAIRRHGELAGIEGKLALVAEVLLGQMRPRGAHRGRRR